MGLNKRLYRVVAMEYVFIEDVVAIKENYLNGKSSVELYGRGKWNDIALSKHNNSLKTVSAPAEMGNLHTHSFTGSVSGHKEDSLNAEKPYVLRPCLVKMHLQNGKVVLAGTKDLPVILSSENVFEDSYLGLSFEYSSAKPLKELAI